MYVLRNGWHPPIDFLLGELWAIVAGLGFGGAWPALRGPLGCGHGQDPFAVQVVVPLVVQWGLQLLTTTPPEFVGSLVLGLVAIQLVVLELGAGLSLGALDAVQQDRIVALTALGTAAAITCHTVADLVHVHRLLPCAANEAGAWTATDQRQCREATVLWTAFAVGLCTGTTGIPRPKTVLAKAGLTVAAATATAIALTAPRMVFVTCACACAGVGWGLFLQRVVPHARNAGN